MVADTLWLFIFSHYWISLFPWLTISSLTTQSGFNPPAAVSILTLFEAEQQRQTSRYHYCDPHQVYNPNLQPMLPETNSHSSATGIQRTVPVLDSVYNSRTSSPNEFTLQLKPLFIKCILIKIFTFFLTLSLLFGSSLFCLSLTTKACVHNVFSAIYLPFHLKKISVLKQQYIWNIRTHRSTNVTAEVMKSCCSLLRNSLSYYYWGKYNIISIEYV